MDFKLTNSGDLALVEKDTSHQLVVLFRTASSPGLEVTFYTEGASSKPPSGGLAISFKTKKEATLKKHAQTVTGKEERLQRILIALRTELGELINKSDTGSRLSKYKHQDIHNTKVLRAIEEAAFGAISHIIENPSVRAVPENGQGNLYFHNISIYIYDNDVQIFKYEL